MSEWKECSLGNVITIRNGYAFKSQHFVDFGIPVIKIKNVKPNKIILDDLSFVPDEIAVQNQKYYIRPDEILITMSGNRSDGSPDSWVGKAAKFKHKGKFLLNQRVSAISPNPHQADVDFLAYKLSSWETQLELINHANSSGGQANISPDTIKNLQFTLPPLPEQRAIASVLSSLDDKIDLLHRQNKTLEAMAETLFRQWFVEEASEDWEEGTLADVTTRITDGSHASPATTESGRPMASVKDMRDWEIDESTCRRISEADYTELVRTDCRPLANDILIAKDGSYLKHVFLLKEDIDIVVLSSIAILRPNLRYDPVLLTIFLKLPFTKVAMENIVTGAVIPRIVLKDFRKFPIQIPPRVIQDQATGMIRPLYMKCWQNIRQICTLEKLRDTLLPKLMSGEVRVQYE
jgi:type I restriction enzyme S subunit